MVSCCRKDGVTALAFVGALRTATRPFLGSPLCHESRACDLVNMHTARHSGDAGDLADNPSPTWKFRGAEGLARERCAKLLS